MGVIEQLRGNSHQAAIWWNKAVEIPTVGARDAHYYLAEVSAANWQWWRARQHLNDGFKGAGSYVEHQRALALKGTVDRAIRLIYGGVISLCVFTFVCIVWFVRRKLTGLTVEEFLSQHPQFHGEVAQICAAIRHEVVKHNTPLLAHIPSANEEQQASIQEKLFGERGADCFAT